MKTIELAKVAARAEALRLRQFTNRLAFRAVFALFAFVFVVGFLACGHVAAVLALVPRFGAIQATLLVGGCDLVLAIAFGLIAGMKGPGRVEREALEVRRRVQDQMARSISVAQLTMPALRVLLARPLWAVARNAFRRGRA